MIEKIKPIKISLLLTMYQSLMYLMSKLSPFEINVIGSKFDSDTPFIPFFIYFYISWYLMLFLIPYKFYFKDKSLFNKYAISLIISISLSFLIYYLFPTTIIRPQVEITNLSSYLVNFIYYIDTPAINCFPSMHCLITFLFMYFTTFEDKFNRCEKIVINVWGILIVLSTLFIKQHVLIDVLSAFIISIIIYLIVNKFKV